MEIFHLRYFVAVAEQLSFSQAARTLPMATSPLSQRVRDLERELGTVLFERDSRSVSLSASGAALLPLAQEVIRKFDDIPLRLSSAAKSEQISYFIGVAPWLHPSIRSTLADFGLQVADHYQLNRWPAGSRELLTAAHQGKLAFALVHLPAQMPGISSHEIFREELGAVLPARQFIGRDSVSLTDLVDFTYIKTAKGTQPTYYDQLEVRMSAAGVHKRAVLSTGDFASPAEVVSNGNAFSLTILDQNISATSRNIDEVVALPFSDFNPELATGIIWRTDRAEEGGDLFELITALREAFAESH